MENQTLLTIFTGIVAAGMLLQSLALIGMYKAFRNLSARLDRLGTDLLKDFEVLTRQTEQMLGSIKTVADKTQAIQESIAKTSTMVHNRLADIDSFLQEVTDVARLQVVRIQDVIESASDKVEDAFDSLHHGVLAPINEVNAIIRGVRVALDVLLRKRRTHSPSARQDEEMFI